MPARGQFQPLAIAPNSAYDSVAVVMILFGIVRLRTVNRRVCFWFFVAGLLARFVVAADDAPLKPLAYNHPGLVVDLGVGLWAWPVPCDADGDGDFDLIVSCPDKPSNGVWLFENTTGDTKQDKFPVFKAARSLGRTTKYVMPNYVDGKLRVTSLGFEHPNFTTTGVQEKVPLGTDIGFYKPQGTAPGGPRLRHQQWRLTDYDGDGAVDLIAAMEDWSDYGWDNAWDANGKWTNGPLRGFVFVLRNEGTTEKPVYAKPQAIDAAGKRLEVYGCPSPNFEDFDGDGDLDLLCGEFLDGFTYFENIVTRSQPRYAAGVRVTTPDGKPCVMDLEMIVPVAFDWDRDGDIDLIVGDEDGRVALVENAGTFGAHHGPQFLEPRYFQQEADKLKCGALATPFGVDWDADGDTDIISGNTAGYIEFFENLSGPKVAEPKWAAPVRLQAGGKTFRVMAGPNGSIQGPAEAKWGYTTLNVADLDDDGLLDIVYNSIWGKVEWLRNIGTRAKPEMAAPQPVDVVWDGATPKPAWLWWNPQKYEFVTQWRTTPVAHDFTGEGFVDLAMLDAEGYLGLLEGFPSAGKGRYALTYPRRIFCDENGKPLRLNAGTAGKSGRRKLCVVDWDGDGELDLLLNSANADLYRGLGKVDGAWRFKKAGALAEQNIEGHDVSPTTVDFDGDGIPDFLGGAEDGRFYFLRNPRSTPR